MYIPSFILNNDVAGLLITIAGQSILVSLLGLTILKVLSRSSAPVRSLVCSATMIALGLTLVISTVFYIKGISWSQATLPFVVEKNTKNSILLPPAQNTVAISPIKALPLEARVQIPVEQNIEGPEPLISPHPAPFVLPVFLLINITGLIWLAGILFQMARLGYGMIIVNKFRNSLQSYRNDHYDKMVQAVAGRFWKKRLPKLYSSPLIKSPVTIGIFDPVVIIPKRLSSNITENEMKSILLHELAHIYHYDQVAGVIKRFIIAFHWWNPFVYIINKEHEKTREEVSDNYVLGELHPKVYSQCLMDLTRKVCLISSYPTAVGMAGRHFNLRKRVEQILSKKRSIAMGTKLRLKVIGFSICLVLTFSIAGIHARGKSVESNNVAKELKEPLQKINPVSIVKEDQKLIQKNLPEPKVVDEPDKLQSTPRSETVPQEELPSKQVQENNEPVMVMASVDMKIMNQTEKPIDSVSVQSSDEPALMKDQTVNKVLAQNETTEGPDLNSAIVPGNAVQNVTPKNISNDSPKMDIDNVISGLTKAIELNNSDAKLYRLRGNTWMEKQNYGQAISDYTKAIEINPDDTAAYNNRGLAYTNIGEYKQAIKDYNKVIKRNPKNINTYINRGNAYYARQKYQEAISDYTRAIKIDPGFSIGYLNRGKSYYQKSSLSKAIKDFSKALELDGRDIWAYLFRGNAYYIKGEYRQAIDNYSKALEINPDLTNVYNIRGMTYEEMGELHKAIYDYSKVIETTSENSIPYINRGRLYVKTDQLDKALSDFNRAIKINPDSVETYSYRSIVYLRMGNKVGAEKDKNMVMKLNPDWNVLVAKRELSALESARQAQGYYRNNFGPSNCVNCPQYEYDFKTMNEVVQDYIEAGHTNGYK